MVALAAGVQREVGPNVEQLGLDVVRVTPRTQDTGLPRGLFNAPRSKPITADAVAELRALPGVVSAVPVVSIPAGVDLRLSLDGVTPALEPLVTGVRGGLARIAAAVVEAHAAGSWPRLKVCVEAGCQWAFIDSSKNRSRSWCSMRVCGNRTKTRAYRARRRAAGGRRPS